ncbi:hypothetical protein C9374_001831 [Naegleria lovaniensis]|uniref:Uncharacterized protein n=1 Tax=Naegleria lovaniensis TaxID=51637 RepID=A0AA88GVU0_NAELO|nr:uncharacterized protein C9374_001831 [Naegleria lovaniensis]KAG2386796.1 hypothetical protein C9374_001831 [Naegleria lovaniensis]
MSHPFTNHNSSSDDGYQPPEKKKKINLTHTQEYSEEAAITSSTSTNINRNIHLTNLIPGNSVDENSQTTSPPHTPESATSTKSSSSLTNNGPIPNPIASNQVVNSLVLSLINGVNKAKSANVFGVGHQHRRQHQVALQKSHNSLSQTLDPNNQDMDLTSDSSDSDADDKHSTTSSSSSSFSSLTSTFTDSLTTTTTTTTIANPFSSTSTNPHTQKSPRRKSHRMLIEKVKNLLLTSPTSPVSLSDSMDWDEIESLDRVYSCCGNNFFGQLSCGDKSRKSLLVQKLCRDSIKHVACGHGFVLIATVNNELYASGDNTYGQCAVGTPAKRHITHLKKAQWDCKMSIQQISCGYHHSMILTTEGKVFACGANAAGALGLGDFINRNTFQRVRLIFFDDAVDHIVCQGHYSAIISKKGRLFVTGVNIGGELGCGDCINRNLFTYISDPVPNVKLIAFRPSFSIVTLTTHEVLICGSTIGPKYQKTIGFPTHIKKIGFDTFRTIVLCENGELYMVEDVDVEFNAESIPQFMFKRVETIPDPVLDFQCGLGYTIARTADSFYALGEKAWIFPALAGKDKTNENPMLEVFTKLRSQTEVHHDRVACGGTFVYFYKKSEVTPAKRYVLCDLLQPFDPFQDITISFESKKRKLWAFVQQSFSFDETKKMKH